MAGVGVKLGDDKTTVLWTRVLFNAWHVDFESPYAYQHAASFKLQQMATHGSGRKSTTRSEKNQSMFVI